MINLTPKINPLPIAFLSIFLLLTKAYSQSPEQQEIAISLDNDAFTIFEDRDRYYTNGVLIDYNRISDQESYILGRVMNGQNISKVVNSFHLKQLLFTPDELDFDDIRVQDRPFAGILAAGYSFKVFYENNWLVSLRQDLGILGPAAGGRQTQALIHDIIDAVDPTAWDFQIRNIVFFNAQLELMKSLELSQNLQVQYESAYQFGSVFNDIRQGFTLRIGRLQPIQNSGYSGSLIPSTASSNETKKLIEWYFVAGGSYQLVIDNATIEGAFRTSPGQRPPINGIRSHVFHLKGGFGFHWKKYDLAYYYFFNTSENDRAGSHRFARIRVACRL